MIAQGSGRIVNLSSQAGFVALPGEAVYCMTKAAISHLTKCLAVEWGEHGITVNAVAPTFIATPGTEPALADPAFRADVEERIAALHRIGTPGRRDRRGRLPRLSGGVADHGPDAPRRRRLDGAMTRRESVPDCYKLVTISVSAADTTVAEQFSLPLPPQGKEPP